MYLDIVLSFNPIAEAASSTARPTFVRDKLENITDSEYESEVGRAIAGIHIASGERDDMHQDSDTADVTHPPILARHLGQATIPCAGRSLSELVGYTELNKAITDDPWSPFSPDDEWNLSRWFVWTKVAKSKIDVDFGQGVGGTDSRSFWSA